MLHTKEVLNTYLAAFCGQPVDKLRRDTDRDFYMTPVEARDYGIVDEVIQHKRVLPDPKIPSLKVRWVHMIPWCCSMRGMVNHDGCSHYLVVCYGCLT